MLLTFYHKVPAVPGIEGVQDAVFSNPFPNAFVEFKKQLGYSIAQKFVDEIFLELLANERV